MTPFIAALANDPLASQLIPTPMCTRPLPGIDDGHWEDRDFMPDGSLDSAIATPSFVDRFRPPGRSTHQVANIHWPSPEATNRDAIIVASPGGLQSSIAYQVYVEGFPHPYSR
jgi:hypothetical protein